MDTINMEVLEMCIDIANEIEIANTIDIANGISQQNEVTRYKRVTINRYVNSMIIISVKSLLIISLLHL